MKNFIKRITLTTLFIFTILSCSKDDAPSSTTPTSNCLSDKFTTVQTDLDNFPGSNNLFINFDVKNTSTTNYNLTTIGTGNFIKYNIKVKTTDGVIYENKGLLLAELSAGATQDVLTNPSYGAGKTYESYTITLFCE